MESTKLSLSILAIVSVIALTSFVMLFQGITGSAVYEQSYSHKPLFIQPSFYISEFDICAQYFCTYEVEGYYRETEKAFKIGVVDLAFPHREPNVRCGCSDGRTFIIRPDFIVEGTYG